MHIPKGISVLLVGLGLVGNKLEFSDNVIHIKINVEGSVLSRWSICNGLCLVLCVEVHVLVMLCKRWCYRT
jgi:hypothetical protein